MINKDEKLYWFIIDLEKESYFYTEDIKLIEKEYPFIYNFMHPNGVKCALFYALYGVNDTIGFIVISTVNNHCFYQLWQD